MKLHFPFFYINFLKSGFYNYSASYFRLPTFQAFHSHMYPEVMTLDSTEHSSFLLTELNPTQLNFTSMIIQILGFNAVLCSQYMMNK